MDVLSARTVAHQKRALNPMGLQFRCCELPCEGWELNLAPLEEQPVFLAIELSLQLQQCTLTVLCWVKTLTASNTQAHALKDKTNENPAGDFGGLCARESVARVWFLWAFLGRGGTFRIEA